MARSVKEWIGKTEDTPAPPRVKDRINKRAGGHCEKCGTPLAGQGIEIDHKEALINWTGAPPHGNRENNLWALGKKCCHRKKTDEDISIKAKSAATRKSHNGLNNPKNRGLRKPEGCIYDWERGRYVRIVA